MSRQDSPEESRLGFTKLHRRLVPADHPVHMVDCQLFGLRPSWHHLHNVLLHAASTVLLFLVLWRMTMALASAFVAASSQFIRSMWNRGLDHRAEGRLGGLFFMLALGRTWAICVVIAGSLVRCDDGLVRPRLLAKPIVITFPLCAAVDYWPLRRMTASANRMGRQRHTAEREAADPTVHRTGVPVPGLPGILKKPPCLLCYLLRLTLWGLGTALECKSGPALVVADSERLISYASYFCRPLSGRA